MTNTNYVYDVRITSGSEILRSGPFALAIPKCGEMIISSNIFTDFDLCEKTMSNLLSQLSQVQANYSDKSHVIVTKMNPLLDMSENKKADTEAWDSFTVMRAYVAETEALKNASTLKYSVIGQIKVNQQILGLKTAEAGH